MGIRAVVAVGTQHIGKVDPLRPRHLLFQPGKQAVIVHPQDSRPIRKVISLVRRHRIADGTAGILQIHPVQIVEACRRIVDHILFQGILHLGGSAAVEVDAVVVLLLEAVVVQHRIHPAPTVPQGELIHGVFAEILGKFPGQHRLGRDLGELLQGSALCIRSGISRSGATA